MTTIDSDPIKRALNWSLRAALQPLWAEVTRRMGASSRPVRHVKVNLPEEGARGALTSLFGESSVRAGPTVTVEVERLRVALGLSASQFRTFLERLCGPIGNRAAERAVSKAARADMWQEASARLQPRIPITFAHLRKSRIAKADIAGYRVALKQLADVLDMLPTKGALPLAALAWRISGDPHALDGHTQAGDCLRRAAHELAGGDEDTHFSYRAHANLAALGVISDRLSTTAITFGLRASEETPLGKLLATAAACNLPYNIAGALLPSAAPPRFVDRSWLCVENPSLIEIAIRDGVTQPLVCTAGWPSLHTQRLLACARDQNIPLRYAGDYDAEGLGIARFMVERFDATIVMSAGSYLAANLCRGPAWRGPVADTPWDPALAEAIRTHRRVVYQEDPALWPLLFG